MMVLMAFCQLDGIVARGGVIHFIMEPVEMQMRNREETLRFIMALRMERPLLLRLAWLQKWTPYVN